MRSSHAENGDVEADHLGVFAGGPCGNADVTLDELAGGLELGQLVAELVDARGDCLVLRGPLLELLEDGGAGSTCRNERRAVQGSARRLDCIGGLNMNSG